MNVAIDTWTWAVTAGARERNRRGWRSGVGDDPHANA
jgi:hypothetical protein